MQVSSFVLSLGGKNITCIEPEEQNAYEGEIKRYNYVEDRTLSNKNAGEYTGKSTKLKQFTSIPWDAYSFGSRGTSNGGIQGDRNPEGRKIILEKQHWEVEVESRNKTSYDGNISCVKRTNSNSRKVNSLYLKDANLL